MEAKPKRELTEAQRLAFLKGREKRMANIEKSRLAKLEFQEMGSTDNDVKPPPEKKARKPRAMKIQTPIPEEIQKPPEISNVIPEENMKTPEKSDTTPPVVIPEIPTLTRQTNQVDEEKIAAIVADKIAAMMKPTEKPVRKPRTVKQESAESHEEKKQSNVPPFVHNFSWL